MSLRTTVADLAQFFAGLQPADVPLYQAPTASDPVSGNMIQGIKFHGVVPTRDPKQPANMQPRTIVSLPDSRIDPITSDRTGTTVFRFNNDKQQYIYYLNVLPGANASWAMTLFFNLDSVASPQTRRTIMQTDGPGAAGEIDIGITSDGKVQVIVMGRTDLAQHVQLAHNSGYIALSYNSARSELSVQVNNTKLDIFSTKLNATSAIFGLSIQRQQPFGPGYLGAIVLHSNQYYKLEQLSLLARYVPLPTPPTPDPEPPLNNETQNIPMSEEQNMADNIPAATPTVSNDLELEPVMPIPIIDPVTGERTLIDQPSSEPIEAPRFRHYNFQIPILTPNNPEDSVESFIATTASGVSHNTESQYVSPIDNHHREYHPN